MRFLASKALAIVAAILFIIGIVAYINAFRHVGWPEAEISSDIGNGAMLVSIAVMLFHIRGCQATERVGRAVQRGDAADDPSAKALGRLVITPSQAFARIEAALRPILKSSGYVDTSSVSHPEAFGSQLSVYTSPKARLQLTWDGKEEFFVLECDRLPNETASGPWIDLTLQQFDPREGDDQWVGELCEDISTAVRDYTDQWTLR